MVQSAKKTRFSRNSARKGDVLLKIRQYRGGRKREESNFGNLPESSVLISRAEPCVHVSM